MRKYFVKLGRWLSFACAQLRAFFRRAAFTRAMRVRSVWKILFACAVYVFWTYLSTNYLAKGFSALLSAQGVTSRTITSASALMRWLAAYAGNIISIITSLGAIVLSRLLLFWFTKNRSIPRVSWKGFFRGALAGGCFVSAGAGLFFLMDSVRARTGIASGFSAGIVMAVLAYLLAAVMEGAFARDLVIKTVAGQAPKWVAYAVSVVIFWGISDAYAMPFQGMINMLFMGALTSALYMLGHESCAVGFLAFWRIFSAVVFAFPGESAVDAPVLTLYSVSEAWLTGGDAGLISGTWTTAVLVSCLGILLWRQVRARKALFAEKAKAPIVQSPLRKTVRKRKNQCKSKGKSAVNPLENRSSPRPKAH